MWLQFFKMSSGLGIWFGVRVRVGVGSGLGLRCYGYSWLQLVTVLGITHIGGSLVYKTVMVRVKVG